MTRMTFGFFRNPIQQTVRSTAQHLASMTFGTYCGLILLKLERDKKHAVAINYNTSPETTISQSLLLNLITPSANRYPFLEEEKRAEIFEHFFDPNKENYDQTTIEMFLKQAVQGKQFTAINTIIRRAEYLASPQLFELITQEFADMSYQMIKLHSEKKLATPFEDAFFSSKSGTEAPRVFFEHPGLAEEVHTFIDEVQNSNESHIRKIIFHDGNMTYNQAIVNASLQGDQLVFHSGNYHAERVFRNELANLLNNRSKLTLYSATH